MSLYWRVLIVNAVVLLTAEAVLSLTPARVPPPVSLGDVVVLVAGLGVMMIANGIMLRLSFGPLRRLVGLMGTIDLLRPQRLQASGGAEVRRLIEAFNDMLDRLEAERRGSSRHALMTQEQERRRIGQELHDEIGQRLTGILLQLGQVAAQAPEHLHSLLLDVQESTRAALDEVGRIAWQLRPGILDDLGLVHALDALVTSFEEQTGIAVTRRFEVDLRAVEPEVELAVYRIAQEGLTNVARHACAGSVELEFEHHGDGLRLRVADDGRGLVGEERAGSGMRGMRERALLIGGVLRIESTAGQGVTLSLAAPGA
ncbi:MAG: HAMP domain-containing sensor histidine kinase [Solirubrobacteraceae bacterium]